MRQYKKLVSLSASLIAGVVALTAAAPSARAALIAGGISFNGNVTPYQTTTGTGPVASSYLPGDAQSLVFGSSVVSNGPTGSFSGISPGTPVTMYSPLLINAPQLPNPATTPLWQVTVGAVTYAFTLTTIEEPYDSAIAMELTGTGIVSDGTPADTNDNGSWVATFTTSGDTFSWNASSSASPVPLPAGASAGLAALAALGLALGARRVMA